MENQNIHEQIKQARKERGMTQQELANDTGLSLRTIQRIEKGEQEVSGYSLKQISGSLSIPLGHLVMPNVNQLRMEAPSAGAVKALYLSSLLFLLNPLLGVIVPAVLGYSKSRHDAFYKQHFNFILRYFGALNVVLYGFAFTFAFDSVLRTGFTRAMFPTIFNYILPLTLVFYGGTIAVILYRIFAIKNSVDRLGHPL